MNRTLDSESCCTLLCLDKMDKKQINQVETLLDVALLNRLHEDYALKGIDHDFAIGLRSNLRYAVSFCAFGFGKINPSGPQPCEFITFAKEDISGRDQRAAINAIGNAKRAVHMICEKLLYALCLEHIHSRSRFPQKLETLEKLELFPIGILRTLNAERNRIEHNYSSANLEQIKAFVEIAELFVLLAYPLLRNVVTGAVVGIEEDEYCYDWVLDRTNNALVLSKLDHNLFKVTSIGKVHYNFNENTPRELLKRISIKMDNEPDWLPYINLFSYLTKREALKMYTDDTQVGQYESKRYITHTDL